MLTLENYINCVSISVYLNLRQFDKSLDKNYDNHTSTKVNVDKKRQVFLELKRRCFAHRINPKCQMELFFWNFTEHSSYTVQHQLHLKCMCTQIEPDISQIY